MAKLELFNTLSGKIETLAPEGEPALRMYCCGPTVYDYGHIGNFRTFLQVDVLRRVLIQQGFPVQHVMNITDVDDKIIRNAGLAGVPIAEYTPRFECAFFEDLDSLGIQRPEHIAHATECIPEMVTLIEHLAEKDIAYKAEDGSWYFRIAKDHDYGKLSKKDFDGIEDGARVDLDEYEKDAARDFALWKACKPNEQSWDTALRLPLPSRLAYRVLCHGGEVPRRHLRPPRWRRRPHVPAPRRTRIAQSESASGKTFARHWMHVRFLLVEGKKMSKSEGNFYTLRDLLLKGHRASAIRLLLISVPYRNQMNFTFDGLTESTNAIDRLRTFHQRMVKTVWPEGLDTDVAEATDKAEKDYTAALADDLEHRLGFACAAIFDMLRVANVAADHGTLRTENVKQILHVLDLFDAVFAVIEDRDAEVTRAALAWAEKEGRIDEAAPELLGRAFALRRRCRCAGDRADPGQA